MSTTQVLKRYPRIAAHLICESLGYLTPKGAANLIIACKKNEPFYCERHTSIAMSKFGKDYSREDVTEVTKEELQYAIRNRHTHHSFMKDYVDAFKIVTKSIEGKDPIFASWF